MVHATSRELKLERPLELAALKEYLEVPDGLLTALTGPDSSGKSALLRSAIAGRAMTTFLDLRQFPVTSDEEFISAFLVSFGYRLPSNDILRRWLLRERQPKQARVIQPEEVDLAFERLTEVLLAEKSRRMHDNAERRLPLLIVSGLEALDAPGLHPESGSTTPSLKPYVPYFFMPHGGRGALTQRLQREGEGQGQGEEQDIHAGCDVSFQVHELRHLRHGRGSRARHRHHLALLPS